DVAEAAVLGALVLVDAPRLRLAQQALAHGQLAQQRVGGALRLGGRQQLLRGDLAAFQQELAQEFDCHCGGAPWFEGSAGGQASTSRSTRSMASGSMGFCR